MRAVALMVLGACSSGTLEFEDANNYAYQSEIAIRSVPMQAGANPCFDWSALTTDIRGRPFDGEVDEAYFTQVAQSQDETVSRFENNTFIQANVVEPFLDNPPSDAKQACGEDFGIIGNDFTADGFDEGEDWLISLTKFRDSPAGGIEPLMSLFVTPVASSDVTRVEITDDSMELEITSLDIAGRPPIFVSEGARRASWSEVTTDVYGNPFSNQDGNELFLARFDVSSAEEIEDVFLTLDTSAAEIYRRDVFSLTNLDDLRTAVDTDGNEFPGFSKDGIWVFGIACALCNNPAPLLLGVVEVE